MPSTGELLLKNIEQQQRNIQESNPYIVDSFKKGSKPYANIQSLNVDLLQKSKSPSKNNNSIAKLDKSDLNHLLKGTTIEHQRKKTMDNMEA